MSISLLVGLWITACTQTQVNGGLSGYAFEQFDIVADGSYTFTRHWFKDAACTEELGTVESENGTMKLGKKLGGMFNSGDTFELDFTTADGNTDLGAVKVKENALNFARGKGWMGRNSMVGFFDYVKQY